MAIGPTHRYPKTPQNCQLLYTLSYYVYNIIYFIIRTRCNDIRAQTLILSVSSQISHQSVPQVCSAALSVGKQTHVHIIWYIIIRIDPILTRTSKTSRHFSLSRVKFIAHPSKMFASIARYASSTRFYIDLRIYIYRLDDRAWNIFFYNFY